MVRPLGNRICDYCDKRFSTPRNLKRHIAALHKNSRVPSFASKPCDIPFQLPPCYELSEQREARHSNIEEGDRPYCTEHETLRRKWKQLVAEAAQLPLSRDESECCGPEYERELCERVSRQYGGSMIRGMMNVDLKHPFTMIVAGPSGSGKTRFALKLITYADKVISPVPEKFVWCYGVYQDVFRNYPDVQFIEGLPDLEMFDGHYKTFLVIDDLMMETTDVITKLFTKLSHHRSVSVLYLTQNVFNKNKENRNISLNAHYMVLFKNVRDASQIQTLARQMYPGQSHLLLEAYKDATSEPFGSLFVDLTQEMDDKFRLRGNIFPDDIRIFYERIPAK
jgi:Zinc finger, C2H2 type